MNFNLPLIDGALAAKCESRAEIVQRMASCLIKYDAFRTEGDAIRALMAKDFSPFHVLRFVDDARQVAMQDVVAGEMSKS